MKANKWLILMMIPVLVIGFLSGCGEEKEPESSYGFLPLEEIEVRVGEEFIIRMSHLFAFIFLNLPLF